MKRWRTDDLVSVYAKLLGAGVEFVSAAEEYGLQILQEGIDLVRAVHAPRTVAHAQRLPKLATFYEKRWPQLEKRLTQRRARFDELR